MGATHGLNESVAFHAHAAAAVEIFRRHGHSSGIATVCGWLAREALEHESYDRAAEYSATLLEALVSLGQRWRVRLLDVSGDTSSGDQVPRWASIDNLRSVFVGLVGVARILAVKDSEDGPRLLGAAGKLLTHTTIEFGSGPLNHFKESATLLESSLGKRRFQALLAEGSRRSIEEALDLALTCARALTVNPSDPVEDEYDLTPREREVLKLLVEGASNAAIADALFISLRTARAHVANILAKLEVPTRTAAATLAIRNQLI
jgi:DNA-binding CsgD family transcriptional regulator